MLHSDSHADFDSLLPCQSTPTGATRRTALLAALGVGYAAATLPVMAQTAITTPSDGLRTGEAAFERDGTNIPLYYAAPAGKTNLPIILVVQEIFGVHAYIADVCRRLAKAGYLALAPALYVRQGDPAKYSNIGQLLSELVSKVPDAQVMADLDAAVQWAGANGGNLKKVGITGFCWGGRVTWLYAAHSKNVKAAVAWYGRLVGTASELTPRHPVDVAASLHAPVLGLYGGRDDGIPIPTVNQMKDALAAAKSNVAARASELVVYPGAPHAFHADYRPSYRQDAATDGFARALAWFKQHGI